MLAIIPALVEKHRVTVVILPLKSLISDYEHRLRGMNIQYELFTGAAEEAISGRYGLILVSADRSRQAKWKHTIARIHLSRTVSRIIFDEAQFAQTSDDFRTTLQNLQDIRSIPVQLCIMSGTVPPSSEAALLEAFGITQMRTIIRMCTDRPELQYLIKEPAKTTRQVCQQVVNIVTQEMQTFLEEDRALVFVTYKEDEGIPIAGQLDCDFYHGGKDLPDSERQAMYARWLEGSHKVMVCTNAFGAGNDYAHVRLVVHAGTPKQMIGYVQEVGRGGRDGEAAKCIVVPRSGASVTKSRVIGAPDFCGYQAIWDMLYKSRECLRYFITKHMDGEGIRCGTIGSSPQCSRCLESLVQPARGPPGEVDAVPM